MERAAAMVVKDENGHLLYLASNHFCCVSPFVAEVEALRWAPEYAERCNYSRIEWEIDAKEVKKAVGSKEEPTCWYAYYSIRSIQRSFATQGWKLNWRSKNCNGVADAAAKLSLSLKTTFVFDEFALHLIPLCIMDLILAKQTDAALGLIINDSTVKIGRGTSQEFVGLMSLEGSWTDFCVVLIGFIVRNLIIKDSYMTIGRGTSPEFVGTISLDGSWTDFCVVLIGFIVRGLIIKDSIMTVGGLIINDSAMKIGRGIRKSLWV
ncbi:hypothetical protein FNV43_RR08638 [Rhamnella rubrinervis]|uniref:RNase H type-1 domain-containing protein n=1 Tax=Rhamnella rubrinervis TaxID=2594499 RepID=A0A8K0H8K3_9ROSA|nr:hypothetical protein FNV43_RR08638 [Rhamnella rubrinervis]